MTCDKCQSAGDYNRWAFDTNVSARAVHPTNCQCSCGHEETRQWEKMYSGKRPDGKNYN